MDGWRCLGEAVVCAFCQTPVAPPAPPGSAQPPATGDASAARSRAAAFLNADPVAAPEFKDKQKGRFCKDCRHYFKHPFYSRCLYHERNVEPMDDCPDFAPRPADPVQSPPGSEPGPGSPPP
jgi:hypothetical protein